MAQLARTFRPPHFVHFLAPAAASGYITNYAAFHRPRRRPLSISALFPAELPLCESNERPVPPSPNPTIPTAKPSPPSALRRCPALAPARHCCKMARSARGRCRLSSRHLRWTPYPVRSHCWKVPDIEGSSKKTSLALEKRDWEDATCSVCMEYPHNAVLLLCSSHDKGCRPYMCGTGYRHSNCLDQFKKAYTKVKPTHEESAVDNPGLGLAMSGWSASQKSEVMELACPLCRGQVKGWTVVEAAREYLNNKKRSCMQDNCSFMGTYKELHKHVRSEHPSAKPREVDPVLEQKWRTLELEREREDVISTIRSSMPRAVVFGDYVIDVNNSDLEPDDAAADADGDYGGSRDISRSILYFLLREGTRLMRLHRENVSSEGREEGSVYAHSVNGRGADIITAYSSEGDDITSHGRGAGMLRSERRRRRRRHRRSRDGSVFGVS